MNKKAIVFGAGVSGRSAKKFIEDHLKYEVLLVDDSEFGAIRTSEVVNLDGVELLILSPGIPRYHPFTQQCLNAGIEVISEVELAYRHFNNRKPIIAITGSNGKTTSATLTAHLLTTLGKKVFLGGNIGIPFCEVFYEADEIDYVVLELSSFQLESCFEFRPQLGIITNITFTHQERYQSFEEYKYAKLRLFQKQNSSCHSLVSSGLSDIKVKANLSLIENLGQFKFKRHQIPENFYVAYWVAKTLGHKIHDQDFQTFIKREKDLPHRVEIIFQNDFLSIYNDSKSTNFEATLKALSFFDPKEVTLILGGKIRNQETSLAKVENLGLRQILLFGELAGVAKGDYLKYENLEDVVATLKEFQPSGVILFSPAFPSFDLYKSYIERGMDFKRLIKEAFSG